MKYLALTILITHLVSYVPAFAQNPVNLEKYRSASLKKWESSIVKMEALNRVQKHPDDSILFIGSSSIRLWKDIVIDMSPYHPIQRGFGGSKWSDQAVYIDRIINPHKFRALVCFVANDISGSKEDKSPEEIVALFSHIWKKARAHQPDAPIFYIAVTPTQSRIKVWPKTRAANTAIRNFCMGKENTYFIGTESIFLDATGKPRSSLFQADQLHLNREGYIRWSAAIKSQLDTVLNGTGG